jgi:6-phosphofructokinase 1
MRVGVLTGGGDCPGLNAVLRAIARKAERHHGDVVFGFVDGWRGVMDREYEMLSVERMRGTLTRGGTVLGTSRITPYMRQDGLDKVRDTVERLELDAMIVVGGDGTLSVGLRVWRDGAVNVIGVPKTIDNDIRATEMTFGFSTAVDIATEAIDRLHTTAESHDRVMVVEVMGRHAGHIATWAGIAGGATVILVPEEPFDLQAVSESIRRRHEGGPYASVVVVAEGALPKEGTIDLPEPGVDQYGHKRLGGIANVVADEIGRRTGYETRVTVLGHVQRGGSPNPFDRVLCSRFGVAAIDAVHAEAWGSMVALQSDRIVTVPIEEAVSGLKLVDDGIWTTAKTFFA